MVANCKIKAASWSLVSVPGSGRSQRTSGFAVSCDLGRVSSLAASISVNQRLPTFVTGNRRLRAFPTKNKLATSPVTTGMPGSSGSPSSEAESKRPRMSECNTSTNATSHRLAQGNVPSSPSVVVSTVTQSSGGHRNSNLYAKRKVCTARRTHPQSPTSQDDNGRTMEDLREELRELRNENDVLRRRLRYYMCVRQVRQRRPQGNVLHMENVLIM